MEREDEGKRSGTGDRNAEMQGMVCIEEDGISGRREIHAESVRLIFIVFVIISHKTQNGNMTSHSANVGYPRVQFQLIPTIKQLTF